MDKKVKDLSIREVVVERATNGKVGIHDGREGGNVRGKLKKGKGIELNGSPHGFNTFDGKFMGHCTLERGKEQSEEALMTADIGAKLRNKFEEKKGVIGVEVLTLRLMEEISTDKATKVTGSGDFIGTRKRRV